MMTAEARTAIESLTGALDTLSPKDRSFAESLMNSVRTQRAAPSGKQLYWLTELYKRATTARPAPACAAVGDLTGVTALFAKAAKHLKRPAIVLSADLTGTATGEEIRLSVGGPNTKHPGAIHVASNGAWADRDYYGRIGTDGTFVESFKKPEGIATEKLVALLRSFAAEPAKVAADHGRLTGRCCFCNLALRDKRSTAVGYGPTCADNYGLPWGAQEAATGLQLACA